MTFFLRVSLKNRNPYLKTSAGRCCAGAFKSGVKGLTIIMPRLVFKFLCMVYEKHITWTEKRHNHEINGILWKIRDYAACLQNAVNLLVA
jgi:hypothetical protein